MKYNQPYSTGLRSVPRQRPRFGPSVLLRLASHLAQSDGASDVLDASSGSSDRVAARPRAARAQHWPH